MPQQIKYHNKYKKHVSVFAAVQKKKKKNTTPISL